MTDKRVSSKKMLILILIVFILSLIPLYKIGFYAHPSADDFSYGIRTKSVWNETHSVSKVLETAAGKTIDKYYKWQGNFTAIFLMYLQPAIWGEEAYFIGPVLLLTAFLLSSILFYYTCFHKILRNTRTKSMIYALLFVFFTLQFIPVPSDSFYWYNGGIYYTFYYSVALFLYSMLIRITTNSKLSIKLLLTVFASILSFFIGGGNFATALLNVILLFFIIAFYVYLKKKEVWFYVPVFLCGMTALIISMIGPGNSLRQATIGSPNSPIMSILLSFVYGVYSVANTTNVSLLLFWLLLIPIFWEMSDQLKLNYKHPILVFLLTFCIYSAQITPVIYAQGIRIPYRIRNIVYFSYYIFVAINLFYITAYFKHQRKITIFQQKKYYPLYYFVMGLSITLLSFGAVEVNEDAEKNIHLSNMPFTASAAYSLLSGEAKAYDEEINERIRLLNESKEPHILLEPLKHQPEVIFHSDITEDPEIWKNRHYAQYYHKKSVRLYD